MDLNLGGKRIMITGASRGIGLACAAAFAREGCELHLVSRSEAALEQARTRLNAEGSVRIHSHAVDLTDPQSLPAIGAIAERVDVLVNNAGAIPGGGFEQVGAARWRESWDLKVFGYIELTRMALPAMMARGHGVIVNVIGIGGAAPGYDYLCGSTANAGLIGFTKAVGAHSTSRGVRVVGVNPGPTETERLVTLYKSRATAALGDEGRWRELLSDLPFGRPARPEEMADLVVFLASERASYLSGVVIDADGGAMYRSIPGARANRP